MIFLLINDANWSLVYNIYLCFIEFVNVGTKNLYPSRSTLTNKNTFSDVLNKSPMLNILFIADRCLKHVVQIIDINLALLAYKFVLYCRNQIQFLQTL